MQKQEYKRAMDLILPDKALIMRTEAAMRFARSGKKRAARRRAPMKIVLAVALIAALLVGVGIASGAIQSVFMLARDRYAGDDPLMGMQYDILLESAAQNVMQTAVPFEGVDDDMRFKLSESYYDGELLILGFTYNNPHRPASFDFGPEHELFNELQNVIDEEAGSELMIDIESCLTPEEYAEFLRRLDENGSAGVIYYDSHMNDGVYGQDGEDLMLGMDAYDQLDDGTQWRYIEFQQPLPDTMRGKDEIGVQFKVTHREYYYYRDASGSYYYFPWGEAYIQSTVLTARIQRGDADVRHYKEEFKREDYAVRVDATVAPAYLKAMFTLDTPAERQEENEWETAFSESTVDYICDFVQVQDGEEMRNEQYGMIMDGNTIYGTYSPLKEGASEIVFRPVYALSGSHPGEDVVIRLEE